MHCPCHSRVVAAPGGIPADSPVVLRIAPQSDRCFGGILDAFFCSRPTPRGIAAVFASPGWALAGKRRPRGTQPPVRQLVNSSQFLLNVAMQVKRIQARLLSLQTRQRLGLTLPRGLDALQRGLRRLIDPTQASPPPTPCAPASPRAETRSSTNAAPGDTDRSWPPPPEPYRSAPNPSACARASSSFARCGRCRPSCKVVRG